MTMENGDIRLRRFSIEDQPIVTKLCNNVNVWNSLQDFLPNPYTGKDAIEFISHCEKENPQVTFAIEYQRKFVGCIGLVLQTDVHSLSAEIGYWIGEPYWGLGICTKAVELSTDYAFNQLNLVRIYARVFDFNLASQRVMGKSGFLLEGIFAKAFRKNGKIGDEYRYAKLNNKFA